MTGFAQSPNIVQASATNHLALACTYKLCQKPLLALVGGQPSCVTSLSGLWEVYPSSSCVTLVVQVVMTANAFVWSFISMPHTPQDDAAAKRVRSSTASFGISWCMCIVCVMLPIPASTDTVSACFACFCVGISQSMSCQTSSLIPPGYHHPDSQFAHKLPLSMSPSLS